MANHIVPLTLCPECGKNLDRASNAIGTGKPEIGDITICLGCATLLEYIEDFALVKLDLNKIIDDPEFMFDILRLRTTILKRRKK